MTTKTFEHTEELVVGLHERGELIYFSSPDEFKSLKSGRKSPNLFNGRGLMSFSRLAGVSLDKQVRTANLAVQGYVHGLEVAKNNFDHIVNLPQAVNPIIGAVAQLYGVSLLYLCTPEAGKHYGAHRAIEGVYQDHDKVMAVDNVISDGGTKFEALEPLEAVGLEVPEFVVLVNREEGGQATLKAAGYDLTSVITKSAATQILLDAGRIRPEQAEWSFEYIDRYNTPSGG